MRTFYIPLLLAGLCILLLGQTGCAKVRYELAADEQLNYYNSKAHTLEVRIFQLRNKKDFDAAGDWKALCSDHCDMSRFLGDPIVERAVYPDTTISRKIRREREAKFLGIVACYYEPTGYPPPTRAVIDLPRRFLGRRARYTIVLGSSQIVRITRRGLFGRERPLASLGIEPPREQRPWDQNDYADEFRQDTQDRYEKKYEQRRDDAIDQGMDRLDPWK